LDELQGHSHNQSSRATTPIPLPRNYFAAAQKIAGLPKIAAAAAESSTVGQHI